jgi:hypothetical protein
MQFNSINYIHIVVKHLQNFHPKDVKILYLLTKIL